MSKLSKLLCPLFSPQTCRALSWRVLRWRTTWWLVIPLRLSRFWVAAAPVPAAALCAAPEVSSEGAAGRLHG